jgi:hypothetical protein
MEFVDAEASVLPTPFTDMVKEEEKNAETRTSWYRLRSRSRNSYASSQYKTMQEMELIQQGILPDPKDDPRRFNWLIVSQPRFANERMKVEQFQRNVRIAYDNSNHILTKVPREMEFGVCLQRPPHHGRNNTTTMTLSSRAYLWIVVDRRYVDKSNILDDKFYNKHFEATKEGMVCVGTGSPDYWCVYKSRRPWAKGSSIKLPPLMPGLVGSSQREPIIVVTKAGDGDRRADFQSNISFEDISSHGARERAKNRLSSGGSLNVGSEEKYQQRNPSSMLSSKPPTALGGKVPSLSSASLASATEDERSRQSSVALSNDQLAMLLALNSSDLKAMCYDRCVDSLKIRRAGNDKNQLIRLLKESSGKQRRINSLKSGSDGRSGGSSAGTSKNNRTSPNNTTPSKFLRRGTGNGGGNSGVARITTPRRTVSPVYRKNSNNNDNNDNTNTKTSTRDLNQNFSATDRDEQERLYKYYALQKRSSTSTTSTTSRNNNYRATTRSNSNSNSNRREEHSTGNNTKRMNHAERERGGNMVGSHKKEAQWVGIVLYDFNPLANTPDEHSQIQIKTHQEVQILQQGTNGWTQGINLTTRKTGWFPTAYVSIGEDPSNRTVPLSSNVSAAAAAAANRRSRIYS